MAQELHSTAFHTGLALPSLVLSLMVASTAALPTFLAHTHKEPQFVQIIRGKITFVIWRETAHLTTENRYLIDFQSSNSFNYLTDCD
jgi:hypothetical protein